MRPTSIFAAALACASAAFAAPTPASVSPELYGNKPNFVADDTKTDVQLYGHFELAVEDKREVEGPPLYGHFELGIDDKKRHA